MVMQNFGGKPGALWSIYESSDYKRCKASVKLSYLTDNLVPRSPRSCAGLRKWRLHDGPTRRTQEGPMKLPDERQSLKRKENWRKLLILGIQPGDKLAKPPFFVAYSRLWRLSRFHFRLCRYFLGHVARRNLPWQGLVRDIIQRTLAIIAWYSFAASNSEGTNYFLSRSLSVLFNFLPPRTNICIEYVFHLRDQY